MKKKKCFLLKDLCSDWKVLKLKLPCRYLQTLHSISAEKNSTIIFPLPVDLLGGLLDQATVRRDHGSGLRRRNNVNASED